MKAIFVTLLVLVFPTIGSTQSMHERHQAAIEASSEVRAVSGGTSVTIVGSYEKVFDQTVRFFNVQGMAVDSANKDSGLIGTAMDIVKKNSIFGGEIGTRAIVTVIRDSDSQTIVRVAVTHQKRDTGLGKVGPWNQPTVDTKASDDLANKVQAGLRAQLAHS